MRFDKVDVAILRALQLDARTRYSKIANTCNVSVDTIIKRYKKLQQKGIVKQTTLLLDPRMLGYEVIANMAIDVEPTSVAEVLGFLKEQEGVTFATHSMGQYDIFAIVMSHTMNEMNSLKEHIQSHTMVREVNTSIWVDQFLLCPQNFELNNEASQ
ncbi:MAG: Lrp/AsnC family transcriptional regulator [Candidatus Bathyarchaeota archaeon]|nr:Lrp/AsnC family transcriptional regulator [Candidatus Bathyarchaeota archaeon]